jgi:ABC-type glycerol-3-phosphate transport system substrate-binding protein
LKRRSWLVLLAFTLGSIVAVFAATAQSKPAAQQQGGEIEVLSLWGGAEKDAFTKVTEAFTRRTGTKINYTTARDFAPVIRTRLAAGNPPEVAIIPRPGVLADLAKQGAVKPLAGLGISNAYMKARYSPAWVQLGTVNGRLYGVAAKANSKSVVWYRPDQFKRYGVKPAKTWAQLISLTKRLKAKGTTPWAAGAKDSWTLTDWFENVYARTAGPAKYNGLFTGKVKFTDASVKRAINQMLQILNNKYLAGGVQGALGTAFVDGIGLVFKPRARAQLYMEGGFVGGIALGDVNKALKPGKTINFFPFPTINPKHGSPLVGGGDLAAAFKDNAQVRAFLKYISSAEAGRIWVSTGAIVSPNKQVKGTAYPNLLVRAEAKQVASAKVFRFDGSDLLPGTLADDWGALLQSAMQRPGSISSLLSDYQKKADKEF